MSLESLLPKEIDLGTIGALVVSHPENGVLYMNVRIARGSVLGHGCYFFNCELGDDVRVGTNAHTSDHFTAGNKVVIGSNARFGRWTQFGHKAKIGHGARFGHWTQFGHGAETRDYTSFGDWAKFGKYAKVGSSCRFGRWAEFKDYPRFGNCNVFCRLGTQFGRKPRFGAYTTFEQGMVLPEDAAELGSGTRYSSDVWIPKHETPHVPLSTCRRIVMYDPTEGAYVSMSPLTYVLCAIGKGLAELPRRLVRTLPTERAA
ncbi:hypothetical protein HYS48_02950 [Candidatus Woesearchaeota archaeon]|nr:hypothetical protein [Candidatus Woesearchaeota archaeon]